MSVRHPESFEPIHMNATYEDFLGNGDIGRYVLLPGSDGRAQEISKYFSNLEVKPHPRGHHLYLGTLPCNEVPNGQINVAAVATGMGCPSIDIILHELCFLGAKRFWRTGSAGSLQNSTVKIGDVVVATGSVRDEDTSATYIPREFPAIPAPEMVAAARRASALHPDIDTHFGIVHCKSSFYGREFGEGPLGKENERYMDIMRTSGVLASEMETSQLFILSTLKGVLAGASLGIICNGYTFTTDQSLMDLTIRHSLTIAIEGIKQLAISEMGR